MVIELRSDTLTQPTDDMRRAMGAARVGDDYFGEDPTIRDLEERSAGLLGKEAALFVVSGTMANLVAVASQVGRGDAVIMETRAHMYRCESAHIVTISGALPRPVEGAIGILRMADVETVIETTPKASDVPQPTLICHENTHAAAGGTCASVNDLQGVRALALRYGLRVHIDGARIFNAAIALGVRPSAIAAEADTISFSLTKGLACPFGALVVGDENTIQRARKIRQMVGGGMHQGGIMAAAGLVGLDCMIERLREDHENARTLAEGLTESGFRIDLRTVQTNIVYVDGFPSGLSRDGFVDLLAREGILVGRSGPTQIRMVTHFGIGHADIERVLLVSRALLVH